MGKREFDSYLWEYSEAFFQKNDRTILELGDDFYKLGISGQGDLIFSEWISSQKNMFTHKKSEMDLPRFKNTGENSEEMLPAYSLALEAFFYSKNDYVDDDGKAIVKKRSDITQETVAQYCNVKRNTVSSWKNGTRKPDKYSWWSFAICVLEISYEDVLPYLDMIGETVNRACLDDMLLYYALCTGKNRYQTYMLLKEYGCVAAMEYFAAL